MTLEHIKELREKNECGALGRGNVVDILDALTETRPMTTGKIDIEHDARVERDEIKASADFMGEMIDDRNAEIVKLRAQLAALTAEREGMAERLGNQQAKILELQAALNACDVTHDEPFDESRWLAERNAGAESFAQSLLNDKGGALTPGRCADAIAEWRRRGVKIAALQQPKAGEVAEDWWAEIRTDGSEVISVTRSLPCASSWTAAIPCRVTYTPPVAKEPEPMHLNALRMLAERLAFTTEAESRVPLLNVADELQRLRESQLAATGKDGGS